MSNFKQSQQNKGDVEILGLLTITYNNINEVVIDEDRNFLLQDGIDTNEFKQNTNSIPEGESNGENSQESDNNETGEHEINDIFQLYESLLR